MSPSKNRGDQECLWLQLRGWGSSGEEHYGVGVPQLPTLVIELFVALLYLHSVWTPAER